MSMKDSKENISSMFKPIDWRELERFCSPVSIRALKNSLAALDAGMPPTPSFKLYGRSDIGVVTDFLDSLAHSRYPDWMLDYEKSRLEKFGPQGGHAPWNELVEDFILYYTRPENEITVDPKLLQEMEKDYAGLTCRLLRPEDTLRYLKDTDKIKERAAGWNTFQLKKTDPYAQEVALRLSKSGLWIHGKGYVFSRYNKLKKRIFMPMPFSSMIVQARWFVDFLRQIQTDLLERVERSPYTFWAEKNGFDFCFTLMSRQLRHKASSAGMKLMYIQRDFEKMDTTTGTAQYEGIFLPILQAAHHLTSKNEIDTLKSAMLFTTQCPILTPSGVIPGNHGTASGAEVTNGGETICNDYYDRRVRSECERLNRELKKPIKYVLVSTVGNGDDGSTVFLVEQERYDEFKTIYTKAANLAARECGFRVQARKWRISDEFGLYCQNMYWEQNGEFKWAYPAVLILNSIINPEHEYNKKDWDKDYRDLDIAEKLYNGRGLLYFKELVIYVCNGLKYPLFGTSERETARILSKYDKYRSLQYESENFNRRDFDMNAMVKFVLDLRHAHLIK